MADEVITIKKESLWKYSTFILAALLVIGAFAYFNQTPTPTGNVITNPGNEVPTQNPQVQASADNDAVLGKKDAPVTIIEFSDYQCPFCGRHYTETHGQLIKDYVDTGKVKIVFRDFPLSFHPEAQKAAEAAECVRDVAKTNKDEAYFKMHDKLFENQATLSVANEKKWAKELGYNIDTCLDSGKFASEVAKDLADGQAAGVQGTPSFVINGQLLVGAQPYTAFKQTIDAALAA